MTNLLRSAVWVAMFPTVNMSLGCDSTPPAVREPSTVDEVTVSDVVADPQKFHAVRVRMKGVCRIEFEGTALYQNSDAYEQRRGAAGVWLRVGWPVAHGIQALNGQEISVEGTFDITKTGHEAAYVGNLTNIREIAGVEIDPVQ